ncbi:unnamed protein product [Rotaria magnacalcarata]|uniref:Protein-S-isoprenylcysteine O-methyltransferase n=1 Tax=Rotaria magnacalcarata TaxID=392030 RepID=A0A814UDX7_9BILA|nr:unnamed protein product [Rotaria magnacalcarata]CAF1585407.1 unnamed protein product [Rotaria magnacalcarata]CAF2159301.1 unnamed protein product [Rotaria magnacalcarata]CAF3775249.1 unnamed protein product [Rotaria magnacalcarata]CAF3782103.1 unnamed protein product [Rotaria magnacalcarata]
MIHFIVLNRFYIKNIFVRAHFLTLLLTVGFVWLITSPAIGLFTVILSLFHLSEYISVGIWCPKTLTLDSFLLNHSPQYHAAIIVAYLEYFFEKYYLFPNGFPYWITILIGLIMILSGECLRKLAMYTANQNFSHLIQEKPNKEHRLITHGIYEYYRHPSYLGWLWWACGTQVLLANPICFFIYLISTWLFFADRIAYEEATLIKCYGDAYRNYQKRVPVGIPFIRGCLYIVFLAFLASIGFTLLILGCALSNYNWWPTFVIIFYVLCPIPLTIARHCTSNDSYGTSDSSPCKDFMWFLTSAIVASAFGLPAILFRANIILAGSMGFIMVANTVVFATISIYFLTLNSDDSLGNF